jgi:galactokinase
MNREGSYNIRRKECETACELLHVDSLRQITLEDLPRVQSLPDPYAKRVMHVVTENERVLRMVSALEHNDLQTAGRLLTESHASMRDDYEVSIPEIDLLVKIAQEEPAAFGARMTGGGFGGAVVVAVEKDAGKNTADSIVSKFKGQVNAPAVSLVPSLDPPEL